MGTFRLAGNVPASKVRVTRAMCSPRESSFVDQNAKTMGEGEEVDSAGPDEVEDERARA